MSRARLCSRCREIFPGYLQDLSLGHIEGTHHSSITSLLDSIKNNCYICALIFDLYGENVDFSRENWDTQHLPHFIQKGRVTEFIGNLNPSIDSDRFHKTLILHDLDSSDLGKQYRARQVLKHHRPVDSGTNTGSSRTLSLAKKWLNNCLSNHADCQNSVQDHVYPKRLIEVGIIGSESVRLVETIECRTTGPYLTLSHCWGKKPFLCLLVENRERLKEAIQLEDLPKTFCDAIQVVRYLGFKYIWIDSLCIIQDSNSDWQEQAPLMCDIYEGAVCCIAATKSRSSYEGLFTDRSPALSGPCVISVAGTRWTPLKPHVMVDAGYWTHRVEAAPLNSRGWVVQEWLLSTRIIHFCQDQIAWECGTILATEEYPVRLPRLLSHRDNKKTSLLRLSHVPVHSSTVLTVRTLWDNILKKFSKSKLSYRKDTLVAISGVAKRLQPFIGGSYLAGVWEGDWVHGLLWKTVGIESCEPSKDYRAPSWSWASIDGRIVPNTHNIGFGLANLVEFDIQPAYEDSFAEVNDGMIRLQGRIFPIEVEVVRHQDDGDALVVQASLLGIDPDKCFDTNHIIRNLHEQNAGMRIYFTALCESLPVTLNKGRIVKSRTGLLLQPIGGEIGCYYRIGLLTVRDNLPGAERFFYDPKFDDDPSVNSEFYIDDHPLKSVFEIR